VAPVRGNVVTGSAMTNFSPVQPKRISDEIGSQIRSQVLDGVLRPGDKLPAERELARQFGASRTAVREALRALVDSGLVKLQRGSRGGAFIATGSEPPLPRDITPPEPVDGMSLADILEARSWVGLMVIQIACDRATEADFDAIEKNLDANEAAILRGDDAARTHHNIEFHYLLASATGNPVIIRVVRSILDMLPPFVRPLTRDEADETLEKRRDVLRLMRERNAEAASLALETHLHRLHTQLLAKPR
jgi:DNA-binding FadR family transcriptional regulator